MALKICKVPVERKIPQNCHSGCNESDGLTALVTKAFRPVRFTLYLRVARPKRSVGMGRSTSDSHPLRTLVRATHRQELISIVQVEAFQQCIDIVIELPGGKRGLRSSVC